MEDESEYNHEDVKSKFYSIKKYVKEQIDYYHSNNKFILYNKGGCRYKYCPNAYNNDDDGYRNYNICFSFFEECDDCDINNNLLEIELERKLNYYILIEKRYYKNFKKSKPAIHHENIGSMLFPDITKFIKTSYNKKIFKLNGKDYFKIKLREFNNIFVTHFQMGICISYIDNIFDHIEIIAIPVKKPYTNLIERYDLDYDDESQNYIGGDLYAEKYKISNNNTLYITPKITNYDFEIQKKDLATVFEKTINRFEKFYFNNNKKLLDSNEIYEEISFFAFIHYLDDDVCQFYTIKGYIKKSLIKIVAE